MKKIFLLLFIFFYCQAKAQNADIELLNRINPSIPTNFSRDFFKGVSSSSYMVSIAAPASVFTVSLIKKDKQLRYKAYQMVVGIGLSMSLSLALKYSIDRARPYEKYTFIFPHTKEDSPSFPSGHTTAAFETATSLSLNFPKWYVIVPSYAWAGAIGYSRMYLGVHYPTDVAAGMLLGAGSAWLTWKINQQLQKRKVARAVDQ